MAFTYTKLMEVTPLPYTGTVAPSAASALYINPASTATYIAELEIHNTSLVEGVVVLFQVPDNATALGTPTLSSQILKITLAAYETVWIEPKYPYVLSDESDAIFGVCSISGVNFQARGGVVV